MSDSAAGVGRRGKVLTRSRCHLILQLGKEGGGGGSLVYARVLFNQKLQNGMSDSAAGECWEEREVRSSFNCLTLQLVGWPRGRDGELLVNIVTLWEDHQGNEEIWWR